MTKVNTKNDGYKQLLEILLQDADSPVYKFTNAPAPGNDLEYLDMWMEYLKYTASDDALAYILRGANLLAYPLENFAGNLSFIKEIRTTFKKALNQRIKKMSFTPRLEQYVNTLPESDREHIRLLILACFMKLDENSKYDEIISICNDLDIPRQFIYSLSEDYPLFKDKVIEFEDSSRHENAPLIQKDIVYNPAIFKIFANLDVSGEELLMLRESSLLTLFDLADESLPLPMPNKDDEDDDELDDDIDLDEDNDDDEPFDFETLMNEIDEESGKEIEEDPDEETEEEDATDQSGGELKPYNNDLEYLYGEYGCIKKLAQIMEGEDSIYLDSDDKRKIDKLKREYEKDKRICEARLQKSQESGFQPRLELLAAKLKLSIFEKNTLKALTALNAFIDKDKSSFRSTVTIGEIMLLLLSNDLERVKAKKYFLKKAKLVKANLIQIESRGLDDSLSECNIII